MKATGSGKQSARPMEVWTAKVPFEGGGGSKERPVVILARKGDSYDTMMCTTHPHPQYESYFPADQFLAGLERSTHVRTDKIFKIRSGDLLMPLGELGDEDADEIRRRYGRIRK